MKNSNAQLIQFVSSDTGIMNALKTVQSLNLPDWCICAGFIRNKVWDCLHNFKDQTPIADVDVIYYDPTHTDKNIDLQYEKLLYEADPTNPWSVKNQARMHEQNGEQPYRSTLDALSKFPETATAIGIRLNDDNQVMLLAPYDVHDLFHLLVRPTPYFEMCWEKKKSVYEARLAKKNWQATWAKLIIVHDV